MFGKTLKQALGKARWLPGGRIGGRTGGREEPNRETINRLVSAVVDRDSAREAAPATDSPVDPTAASVTDAVAHATHGDAEREAREMLRLIRSIRRVGASDAPLPESGVDTIMRALEREARATPRRDADRERVGMVFGFLACALTLGSGLILVGGLRLRATFGRGRDADPGRRRRVPRGPRRRTPSPAIGAATPDAPAAGSRHARHAVVRPGALGQRRGRGRDPPLGAHHSSRRAKLCTGCATSSNPVT